MIEARAIAKVDHLDCVCKASISLGLLVNNGLRKLGKIYCRCYDFIKNAKHTNYDAINKF